MSTATATPPLSANEAQLRLRRCAKCGSTVWDALNEGCGALWNRCSPAFVDFNDPNNLQPVEVRSAAP